MRIYPNSKVLHTCVQCGGQSFRDRYKAARRFCSRPCWNAWQRANTVALFWARVDKSGDCWLWMRGKQRTGYGFMAGSASGKSSIRVHRHAWVEASGAPIPDGQYVLHCCDVRHCVRNDEPGIYTVGGIDYPRWGHLWLGPQTANLLDMTEKGRRNYSPSKPEHPRATTNLQRGEQHWSHRHPERVTRGEQHGSRIHPETIVRGERTGAAKLTDAEARAIKAALQTGARGAQLARQYHVSKSIVSMIKQGKTWKHV